jgi:uncharacterized membrane protein (DUF106 family)
MFHKVQEFQMIAQALNSCYHHLSKDGDQHAIKTIHDAHEQFLKALSHATSVEKQFLNYTYK